MRWDLIGVALTVLTWLVGPNMSEPIRVLLYAVSAGLIGYGVAPAILARLPLRIRKVWPILTLCVGVAVAAFGVYWLIMENSVGQATTGWRQTPTSFYEILGNPIKNENWTSLLGVADEARRANEETPYGLSLNQKPFNDILSAYAAKINDAVQLYGTRPGPVESEPIKERGDQIIFRVNGMQMDSISPTGHQLYRYIHLHTADVPKALVAVHKMATSQ